MNFFQDTNPSTCDIQINKPWKSEKKKRDIYQCQIKRNYFKSKDKKTYLNIGCFFPIIVLNMHSIIII